MQRIAFVVLPLFLISSQVVLGQVDSSRTIDFSGRIIDDSLEYALPSVHLWNESNRMGNISNDAGEFSIMVGIHDTLVFSSIGYTSKVIVVSSSLNQPAVIRLKPIKYAIGEVEVRRFRNYASFKYQVLHLDLPDPIPADLRSNIKVTSITAALEADRERAEKLKMETGGFGFITPLGGGIDLQKAFREKTLNQKQREKVIHAKFNRELVGDITQLDGDELTKFIAMCDFSEDYLYETNLYTIIEDLHAKLSDYQFMIDTIPSVNER